MQNACTATKTFEERIAEYDARRDVHYYVYFSINTYRYEVDTIQFKKKSDLKNEYYRKLKFFSTYAVAKREADRLTDKDQSLAHMFGRAASEFREKLNKISKLAAERVKTNPNDSDARAQAKLIDAAYWSAVAYTDIINKNVKATDCLAKGGR